MYAYIITNVYLVTGSELTPPTHTCTCTCTYIC